MAIEFGPAGIGPVKEAINNLKEYHKLGLRACEIAFTYGVYIKHENDIKEIKEAAEKSEIKLSVHAPYWINLNSKDKKKIEQSKERILKCCETGEKLGAYRVVFHPGYYSGMDKEKSYENIRDAISDIQKEIKKHKWKIKIAPETSGKVNVFGSVDEIKRLVKDTNCSFCIDFAHVLARYKKVDYELIKEMFDEFHDWHVHFSGIVYGEKGEKNHIKTQPKELKELLKNLPKNKNIVIINESPYPVEDSVQALKINNK